MKTFLYGLGFCGILTASVAAIYFFPAKPAFSLPQHKLSTIEQSLAKELQADLGQSHFAREWVEVKDCAITFRHESPPTCSNGDELSYSETRLDLHEIAAIDYFEVPNPDADFRSSITFEFIAEVKQRFNAAKEKMWEFLGSRKGAPESMWSEHVIAAEQRILKSMKLDSLGSHALSGGCGGQSNHLHLPEEKHILQLRGRDQEIAEKLKLYFSHCASN